MKKEISKSKGKKVVKEGKNKQKLITKLKLRKDIRINIVIGLVVILFIVLFIFIIIGVVKYFNNKIDKKNKEIIEEYKNDNKKVCFKDECFYIIDYSIEDRTVSLFAEKNISLEEKSIQIDEEMDIVDRKDINKYLNYYKEMISDLGVDVIDIGIPNNNQLEKNGCSFKNNTSNIYTCSEDNNWIYSTSYYYEGDVSGVMVNIKDLDSHFIFPFDMSKKELDDMYGKDSTLNVGIRPVIKVSISEIE